MEGGSWRRYEECITLRSRMHKWNYFYISMFCLPDTQNKYESGGLHYTVYTMPESKKLIFIDISPLVFPQVFRYILYFLSIDESNKRNLRHL